MLPEQKSTCQCMAKMTKGHSTENKLLLYFCLLIYTFIISIYYLFNVKVENVLHVRWKLIDDGKVTKDTAAMSYDNGPDWE